MNTSGWGLLVAAVTLAALAGAGSQGALAATYRAETGIAARNRILVTWRQDVPAAQRRLAGLDYVTGARELPEAGISIARVTHGSASAARARLARDPRVDSASDDLPLHADLTPNDAQYQGQWALQKMQTPWAWELLRGGGQVTVAVLDSGVDLTHPDLIGHVLPIGCNVVADHICPADGHGTPATDEDGHGSHVAGIVAASTDNRDGIAGMSWTASILPVKVTTAGNGTESDFLGGLVWAVDHGANVLNFSFSEDCGTQESTAMRAGIDYAWNHGAVLVASAGNGAGCPGGVYPAADPRVLSVASTDMNDRPSSFSNFGPWVRVAAPGEGILSTWAAGQYSVASGTSMAAPQVAGLAALLFSVPGATNASVVNWILSTTDLPAGWNPAFGRGRINAYRAVSLAVTGTDPRGTVPAAVSVHLNRGWNNLLYLGPTLPVASALAPLTGKYGGVYAWDPARSAWLTYLPGETAASNLIMLQERSAYWIYLQADADFSMTGSGVAPPHQQTLSRGWNNVALQPGSLPAALQQFSDPITSVFGWNPLMAAWNGFFTGRPALSELNSIKSNAAYWVYAPGKVIVRMDR